MAYKALATPEAGADPTGTALVSPDGNGKRLKLSEAISSGDPIWLISAPRSGATEAFVPLGLAPGEAEILAVGRHPVFPIFAVAWLSDRNEIVVAVEADRTETGRSVVIRVYTRDSNILCRAAVFEACGDRAVAAAVMGVWDGLPVAGLTFLSLIEPGEEL